MYKRRGWYKIFSKVRFFFLVMSLWLSDWQFPGLLLAGFHAPVISSLISDFGTEH